MYCIEQNKDFFDRPVRLSLEERNDAMNVIGCFFSSMPLSDIRIQLQRLLYAALTTSDEHFSDASERKNIHWFINETESFFEAALLLYEAYEQRELLKIVKPAKP